MRRIFFLVVLLCFYLPTTNAQEFQDDFNDNSFPTDPDWIGNTSIYVVNAANELQLMDVDGGESFITAAALTSDSTTWEFLTRLEFEPSPSNQLRVYLNATNPDLDANQNAYFIQIGASGGDDAIELRRQDGATTNTDLLLSGVAGNAANNPFVRIRVTRDGGANWRLQVDYTGGTTFEEEGMVNDDTYNGGAYFGFKCRYTSTRRDKFYFDDVLIGPLLQDETAPSLLTASAEDANTILIQFDEPLDETVAENINNYLLDNGVTINSATLSADPTVVRLDVTTLNSGTEYLLSVQNIEDVNGNVLMSAETSLTYFLIENAVAFDILINEVFPKPDSEISGLPDAEFIELYNRSDKVIELEDFEIADASSSKTLSAYLFLPQTYLIICDAEDVDLFQSFGNVLGVPSLFALNNDSGDAVSLTNAEGISIHDMTYTNETFQDLEKQAGGWSLELINPNLYCQGESNWRASIALIGGTPGTQNSLFEDIPDVTPPSVIEIIAVSENQVKVFFDETLGAGAGIVQSYEIPGVGGIETIDVNENLQEVTLTIGAPFFQDQGTYALLINDLLADCSGNGVGDLSLSFTFFQTAPAERYDILINEFYPDVSPSLGLPEQEFIELYNRSDKTINLEGFILRNGNQDILLPLFLLRPGAYVILKEGSGSDFDIFGDNIGLSTFTTLGNTADEFGLYNPDGTFIHAVDYDKSWYQDANKTEGGWTLELINPGIPCAFETNWRASEAAVGGTPGTQNSVYDLKQDETPLDVLRAFPISDNAVILFFNKALDESTALELDNYTVEGLTLNAVSLIAPFDRVLLRFAEDLVPEEIYRVQLRSAVTDCIGNGVGVFDEARFALPQTIEEGAIIINEVLYDPEAGGSRFVELYNNSDQVFNLGDLHIADRDEDGLAIDGNFEIETDYLLFPEAYVVLSTFPQNIKDTYFVENTNVLLENSLPAYDAREDAVVLFVPDALGPKIIDELKYTRDFHNPLLDDEEGVSLERISFSGATQDLANWQSAAETAGFATPTYINSQALENLSATDNIFDLANTTLSPDGDGFEDFLLINYNTSQGGWVANIQLFDANGRLIKRLVQNQSLASNGSFKWEGDTDDGTKARIGIYVVWIEVFKSDGTVQQIKKTCTLAGQF